MKERLHHLELSAVATVLGIILFFSGAVIVTLLAPNFVEPTWIQPSSEYQRQMYEVSDPNLYLSSLHKGSKELQTIYHLKKGYTLLAFQEDESLRIVAPEKLEKYITRHEEPTLKLTSQLLLLRKPQKNGDFNGEQAALELRQALSQAWESSKEDLKGPVPPAFTILELWMPEGEEAFSVAPADRMIENWIDDQYKLLDPPQHPYQQSQGVIYVSNPMEYRISFYTFGNENMWSYDPNGQPLRGLKELKEHPLGFLSRQELIQTGEHLYAIEGCWYCHTDQTRTLVQDVVLNGSAAFPAPPSTPNEYIYQRITFPGTRRIGPDLSRVGVKKPSRDWHQSHFWSPQTASKGSIMPSFKHFFDDDPRGTGPRTSSLPNMQFEAIFQYLMTKGTRITPPNQAWWLGLDPVNTKEIIEGKKK